MRYIDIHAHLHDKAFNSDRESVIAQMKEQGIGAITIGTDFEESQKAVVLAEKHENIWATVGFHPVDNKIEVFDADTYEELARHPKVVAIGECGLDYYWPTKDGALSAEEKERQKKNFQAHIELALKVDKPLMLHGRPSNKTMDAYEDMLAMLLPYKGKVKGNAHFFAGDVRIAQGFLDIGFTMSFPGVITFAKELEATVSFVPLESMHAETDSPYATPVPHRGKRNSPLHVSLIASKIAELKHVPLSQVEEQLIENCRKLFGIDKSSAKE